MQGRHHPDRTVANADLALAADEWLAGDVLIAAGRHSPGGGAAAGADEIAPGVRMGWSETVIQPKESDEARFERMSNEEIIKELEDWT